MHGPILGATLFGSQAHLVRAEARCGRGLSRVILVGMPDAVAREARERLPSAFEQFDLPFPKGKVLLNLVPAQMPKCGLPLDLAIAVSLLVEEKLVQRPAQPILFLAELDLKGRLGPPARGTLLAALAAVQQRCAILITAPEAAQEAALAPGVEAFGLEDLGQVVQYLKSPQSFRPIRRLPIDQSSRSKQARSPRLDDLRGQEHAKKAAVLAIAGHHPLWMQGPPGTGKSMLARRLAHLLPDLTAKRALEVGMIEALLHPLPGLSRRPPFRAPHTSASAQALLGGGTPLRPGELARAHGGILFLDEIPEFARPVLEGLRQPLEEGEVRLQRAREWATYPAEVQLIATSNPCPCGYATHPKMPCRCTPHKRNSYAQRISGPLRDRFDLFVEMGPVSAEVLEGPATSPTDEELMANLERVRDLQQARHAGGGFLRSIEASVEELQQAGITSEARHLLRQAVDRLPLSGRGLLRCLRVARTAADLAGHAGIEAQDLRLALSYRPLPTTEEAATGPLHSPRRATRHQLPKASAHSPRDTED